jgi:hypothetical protein
MRVAVEKFPEENHKSSVDKKASYMALAVCRQGNYKKLKHKKANIPCKTFPQETHGVRLATSGR